MSGVIRWITAAVAGGLAGAFAWAAITYFTGYEIGWIAWGVGFVVGAAVRMGAGSDTGYGPGSVAAIGAIGALLLGKYAAVYFLVNQSVAEMPVPVVTANDLTISLADEVVEEWTQAGKTVTFPEGQSVETAEEQSHYPADVWAEAVKRLGEVPQEEQQKQIAERQAAMTQLSGMVREMATEEGFKDSFSPIDLLFFGLAVWTAFRMGSGMTSAQS